MRTLSSMRSSARFPRRLSQCALLRRIEDPSNGTAEIASPDPSDVACRTVTLMQPRKARLASTRTTAADHATDAADSKGSLRRRLTEDGQDFDPPGDVRRALPLRSE